MADYDYCTAKKCHFDIFEILQNVFMECHSWVEYAVVCVCVCVPIWYSLLQYGVATLCRLLQIIGLFGKKALQKRLYSAKKTYNFMEPTNRSHPIWYSLLQLECQSI